MICVKLQTCLSAYLMFHLKTNFGLSNTLQLLTYREMFRLGQKTGSGLYLAIDFFMRKKKLF